MIRLFAVPLLAGIAAAFGAYYLRAQMPAPLPSLTLVESVFAGIGIFVVLVALASHVILQRLGAGFRARMDAVGSFEAELRKKVLDAETQMAGLALAAEVNQTQIEALQRTALKAEAASLAKLEPAPLSEQLDDDKVVPFDPAARPRHDKKGGIAGEGASPKGVIEIWFQPVVTLPGRKTRFFDSLVYISPTPTGANAPAPPTAVPAGRDVLVLADTSETALIEALKLARELDRADRAGGIIWHTNAALYADLAAHRRLKSILEANSKIASRLIPAIAHKVFSRLNRSAVERLHAFKDLGYRIAVVDLPDAGTARACLRGGLFSIVIGEARALIDMGSAAAGPAAVKFQEFGVEAMATNVLDEDTAMALIDQDILLAKGSLFSPPKPLKRNAARQAGTG